MRVVAGTFKGQRLVAPKRASTRPTADRVREALFSMLAPVDGELVLDLYAGSGALGIEALSRGATQAVLVDSDIASTAAMGQNIDRLGIEQARVVRADVGAFLKKAARRGEQWSLVFCDPPYRLAHRLGRELEARLPPILAEGARIVCESSTKQPLQLGLPLVTERRYGDTLICIYRCNAGTGGRD